MPDKNRIKALMKLAKDDSYENMDQFLIDADKAYAEYKKRKNIESIKAALLAALVGGAGGSALTAVHGGDAGAIAGAGAVSALGSGLGTYALNMLSD